MGFVFIPLLPMLFAHLILQLSGEKQVLSANTKPDKTHGQVQRQVKNITSAWVPWPGLARGWDGRRLRRFRHVSRTPPCTGHYLPLRYPGLSDRRSSYRVVEAPSLPESPTQIRLVRGAHVAVFVQQAPPGIAVRKD